MKLIKDYWQRHRWRSHKIDRSQQNCYGCFCFQTPQSEYSVLAAFNHTQTTIFQALAGSLGKAQKTFPLLHIGHSWGRLDGNFTNIETIKCDQFDKLIIACHISEKMVPSLPYTSMHLHWADFLPSDLAGLLVKSTYRKGTDGHDWIMLLHQLVWFGLLGEGQLWVGNQDIMRAKISQSKIHITTVLLLQSLFSHMS